MSMREQFDYSIRLRLDNLTLLSVFHVEQEKDF